MSSSPTRVLIVKLSSLGDIVHAWPAYAGLRAARPQWQLAWLVEKRWAPLVQSLPGLDAVFTIDSRSVGRAAFFRNLAQLRQFRPDYALDWQGAWKSAGLAWLSGAPRRIGLASDWLREPGAAWLYSQTVIPVGTHVSEQLLAVARTLAPEAQLRLLPIDLGAAARARAQSWLQARGIQTFLFISPGGGWLGKQWPRNRYLELGRRLLPSLAHSIVWNLEPGAPAAALPSGFYTFQGNLELLMALASQARLAIGGDTGPLHLAAALGTPVVALFGPTDPERNRPWARHARILFQGRPRPAGEAAHGRFPRGKTPAAEMLAISVEEAAAACRELLAESAREAAAVAP